MAATRDRVLPDWTFKYAGINARNGRRIRCYFTIARSGALITRMNCRNMGLRDDLFVFGEGDAPTKGMKHPSLTR